MEILTYGKSTQQDIRDIRLVNRQVAGDPFAAGAMTIRLDAAGNPETVTGAEALDQDILKSIFTKTCGDGYGTVVHRVLGGKNTTVVRAMITYTVIGTLQKLLLLHASLKRAFPMGFRRQRCLAAVDYINVDVDDSDRRRVVVKVDFRTDEDSIRQASGQFYSGAIPEV